MKDNYDDIINMNRPVFTNRKRMSNHDRAAQFAPFAALDGYESAVDETARLTDSAIEIDEYEKQKIDRRLRYIKDKGKEITVKITYFVPDSKKAGGAFRVCEAKVDKIREFENEIVMSNGDIIPTERIVCVDSDIFNKTESNEEMNYYEF